MKKKKFSNFEIKNILSEEKKRGDISKICLKYNIHISTFYRWKSRFSEKGNRTVYITTRLSEKEHAIFTKKCKDFGFEDNHSEFIRKMIFNKSILTVDPKLIFKEFTSLRAELNKVGSNLNQIAHYANFLRNQNYLDDDGLKNFKETAFELIKKENEIKDLIYKMFAKL